MDLMPGLDRTSPVDAELLIGAIERHWRFRVWSFGLAGRRPAHVASLVRYHSVIEWLVREYAAAHDRVAAKLWVDQSLFVHHTWKLLQHFPDARFIHLIRDGRAVAASIIPLDWGPTGVYGAARLWEDCLAHGFAAGATLGSERLIHVHYETIVADPAAAMERIAAFLGLDFDPAMTSPSGLDLPEYTRYQHTLIGKPLDSRRIDAWRNQLKKREIEIFEALTGDLIRLLGYQPLSSHVPQPLGSTEKVRLVFMERMKRLANKIQNRVRRYRFSRRGQGQR